jgi:ubiquinone/menaquinone biosynthesis C-methylase UbiE
MTESKEIQIGQFSNVKEAEDADRFVTFLDWIECLPQAKALRQYTYELLEMTPGLTAIDVGCGAGRAVAELTGMGLKVIGIDISEKMITIAKNRFPKSDFRMASAETLPLNKGSVNYYRAERLYQHLKDPKSALLEARRVLISGGKIVLSDQDYDMWAIDSDNQIITRSIIRALSDSINYRWIGRRYHSLLLNAGFMNVKVEVQTLIYTDYKQAGPGLASFAEAAASTDVISRVQADDWLDEQKQRGTEDRFFLALPMFVASAIQP